MIGQKLLHYEILELLGKGGMGEVYRARDSKLDRDVAIKILPPDKAADPERLARFEREAKAVATLNHPNIVTIHSVEEAEGRHFLTMELVEGKTLHELIPSTGIALEKLFHIAIPLADALSAAHAKGITHRDLKPSNVMLDTGGRLKVLDFGLAKLMAAAGEFGDDTVVQSDEPVTAEGKVLGTMNYMSPEQAESKDVDHRSDIFSLGVLLYEMSTGVRPFQGDTPISTISAILKDTPQPLSQRKATLPRHLGRVVSRCLEKNPDKRYQTARDVCNELEGLQKEIASGEYEQQFSASISRDDLIPAQRKGRAMTWPWIALAVVAVAVAGYFAFFRGGSAPAQRELKATPLTSLAGVELPGSWSPDGGFFVYAHSASGPMDIFVASVAGGTPMRLVESPYDDVRPVWSPDNRWIAFVSGRGETMGVYLVPPLGGEPQLLLDLGRSRLSSGGGNFVFGSNPWSPDGKKLLLSLQSEARETAVWEIDLATRERRQLTEPGQGHFDGLASYSRAGDRVLFNRGGGGASRLFVMPASGGEASMILEMDASYILGNWSPDDRKILYSPNAGGVFEVDLRSGKKERVTTGTTEFMPLVGDDGKVLYATDSHQTDLYLQSLEDGSARRLTFHTSDNFSARISPDGSKVVYQSDRTGDNELWLYDLESGSERQLTQRKGPDWSAHWHPSGREIVFGFESDGVEGIWALDVAAAAPRKLYEHPDARAGSPKLSLDGRQIGFTRQGGESRALFAMEYPTGEPAEILAGVSDFEWYVDSRHVLYTPFGADHELRVADLETGESALLLEADHREYAVSADGRVLTYISSLSHYNMNLFVVELDPAGGEHGLPRVIAEPRQVTHGDGEWHVHNGSVSADGSRVVYTRDTDTGDIYLLEGVY